MLSNMLGITLLGMPLLILTNGISNLIRADGSPKYSMICMVSGAIVNTILDPLFIFQFHWGVAGAAWATVLGQVLSFLLALRYLWQFRTVRLTRTCFAVSIPDTLKTLYMGISSCINQVAITVVQIVLNNSLTHYGALSSFGEEIPLAACGIVMKTNAILLSIIVGISQGMQPIIGYNYGAGKIEAGKKCLSAGTEMELCGFCSGVFTLSVFPAPHHFPIWQREFSVL